MTDSQSREMQTTLQREVAVSGIGIFTGLKTAIRILPAPIGTGIVFKRVDITNAPEIPALLPFVQGTPRCTCLGTEENKIIMVEHLLSALYAYGVDHARIEVDGPEIPAVDGSSQAFVELIESAGLQKLEKPRDLIRIEEPVYWSEGDVHLVALPSPTFRLSYTMHHPKSSLINSQYYSFRMSPDGYREEIAASRTFSFYEDILPFLEKGLIKGGGLKNAVIIQDDKVVNPEGTRFPDEMVRHKILDLIGDLSLLGRRLSAHIIAVCSGHKSNVAFAKTLSKTLKLEET